MISSFSGAHRFLSNYYHAPIRLAGEHFGERGLTFPTNEHAFAACKTLDPSLRVQIASLPTPGDAKRFGRHISLRTDWDVIRVPVMQALVRAKFTQHEDLARLLLLTNGEALVEGNNWGDTFWGVDARTSVGANQLGLLLMAERARLSHSWAYCEPSSHGRVASYDVAPEMALVL